MSNGLTLPFTGAIADPNASAFSVTNEFGNMIVGVRNLAMKAYLKWAVTVAWALSATLVQGEERCRVTADAADASVASVITTVRDAVTGRPVLGALVQWRSEDRAMTGSTD